MTPDPVTKLAKRLRSMAVKAYYRNGGQLQQFPWDALNVAPKAAWFAIASHILSHYARLTPDARRLLKRVRGKKG